VFAAAALALPAAAGAAPSAPDQIARIAGLDVALWVPAGSGSGPRPLVLFSHGFGGCKIRSSYLMRALSEHGFVVAAPDHRDNECASGRPPTALPPGFLNPANWGPSFYDDRRDDMQGLRAALLAGDPVAGPVDTSRVVLVGHSLGGYTALGLAGGWPNWSTGGVAAVVALAPFVEPLLAGGGSGLAAISAPVLFQAGTEDPSITEALEARGAFARTGTATAASACKVVYRGADHFAWTDLRTEFQGATAAATIAFLDEVLAGRRPTAALFASSGAARTECR
jgi:predicted dienelactone hydrolase